MRPIKFRMWIQHKEEKGIMVYRGIYDKNWYYHPTKSILYREIKQSDHVFTIMQFTGLHDRNGKEIYEGDILFQDDYRHLKPIFSVSWDEEEAGFFPFTTGYKIIGNIYENPELLETK